MNVKLAHVICDITGVTGLATIRAILSGQFDLRTLATLRDPRCKTDAATIARSLEGNWRSEHLFELRQALELVEFYQTQIGACDHEIEAQLLGVRRQARRPDPDRRVPLAEGQTERRPASMFASTSIASPASISPGSMGSMPPRPLRWSPRSGST